MANEAADGGGSVLKKYGPAALIVLIVQGILAWVIITFALKGGVPGVPQEPLIPPETQITTGGEEQVRTALPFYYESAALKNITANPAGTNASRFVVFTVQLGLSALDHDDSPATDITATLDQHPGVTTKLALYDQKMKSLIVGVVRLRTVEELDGEVIDQVEEEIRTELNREVMQRVFPVTEDSKIEVQVQEVVFSDIIIQ